MVWSQVLKKAYFYIPFILLCNWIKQAEIVNKKNYNMILSCYNYGRVTIIYDAIVNY